MVGTVPEVGGVPTTRDGCTGYWLVLAGPGTLAWLTWPWDTGLRDTGLRDTDLWYTGLWDTAFGTLASVTLALVIQGLSHTRP